MKIIEFSADNFARLSAVAIRPGEALVQITGRNGQGKSSCLNAIWTALKGRTVAPPQPIRKGEEQATLKLDLGDMTIVRTFKRRGDVETTTDLKVTMADGRRITKSPQAVIDAVLGDLTFDPLEFSKLEPKEQFDRVKALVPGFDFEANAQRRQAAFDDRTELNRKARDARSRASGIQLPAGPRPRSPPDVADLTRQMKEIDTANRNIERQQTLRNMEVDAIDALQDEAEKLESRLVALRKEIKTRNDVHEALDELPAMIDVEPIIAQIEGVEGVHKIIALFDARDRHTAEADGAEKTAATMTDEIEACDKEKREAIEGAKMPVAGLTFGDDEVLLNGLPLSQAGTAEKIVASMQIGMALNPELRVMLIDEGSELDSNAISLVASIAGDHDYQVWMTRVEESGKVGFVIEDGTLKNREAL